jgi:hypothetical protein
MLNFPAVQMEKSGSSITSVPICQAVRRLIAKGRNIFCDWLVKKQRASSFFNLDFAAGVRIDIVTRLVQRRALFAAGTV